IGYIETHGTATALGDPIEIEALKQVFTSKTDKKNFCAIGSVKTNIGHLDSAAGISSFIKTVLALKNRMIPPSLNFEIPNPQLVLIDSPFYVNDSLSEWERENGYHTLKAGVSSFGIGGTNAHVVLEEAPEIEISPPGRKYQLIVLSAKTETALERSIDNLSGYLKSNKNINLADVAYTLHVGRKSFQYRTMSVCSDVNEAIQSLVPPNPTAPVENCTRFSSSIEETERSVVFMFPGEGSQYINMGWGLYKEEPRFRLRIQRCFDMLRTEAGYDIASMIYPGTVETHITQQELEFKHPGKQEKDLLDPGTLHPFIFIFEYALAKLLIEWGITPALMIGYDIGEYVAAQISGIFSLEDALALVALRGTLIQQIRCGYLEETSALNRFRERLHRVSFNKSSIPCISCTTGTWIIDQEATNPEYWLTHMQVRKNIHLTGEIGELIQKQDQLLVEMGTGQDLCKRLEKLREKSFGPLAVPIVRQSTESIPDTYFLLKKIGNLWLNGISMNYDSFYSQEKRCRIPLPAYPFEKRKFKVEIPRLNVSFLNTLQEKPDIIENAGISSPSSKVDPPPLQKMSLNEMERKICSILENILGIEDISVEEDLSQLGLDSLKTIILGIEIYKILQVKIKLDALFDHSNIKELAVYISRVHQDDCGAGTNANEDVPGVFSPVREEEKFKPQPNWNTDEISDAREVPGHILLTGATGFYGSHVLKDIIDKTGAKIYCLLRGDTVKDASRRLKQILNHYFDSTYQKHLDRRIFVIKGDITRSRLGMEQSCYDELAGTIDAVIHSAADVRHYGKYKDFKKTNVESTQKIIDFCFYGKEKKMHHISTIGVAGIPSQRVTFREWDLNIGQSFEGLVYSKSKFEAEMLVYRARERGLKASIYRVGNLVGRWKDGVFQENIETNQLYNDIKALVHLGKSPANLENEGIEITPVDLCTQGFFNLFLLKDALGYNFHLMNSYRIPLGKLIRFMNRFGFQIDLVDFKTFQHHVYSEVKSKPFIKALSGIFYNLQPGDDGSENGLSRVTFDDTFTVRVLKKTGFSWTRLDFDYISKMLEYCIDVGYLTFR
ncbi:MAG: SDR family oxidoreductase, partial [Candidatus Aminicenantes bacterium]